MSTIEPHFDGQTAFEPEALRAMSQAFQDTCNALHIFAEDARGREAIATRIIDLAGAGVLDPHVLRDRVLSEAHAAA